MVEEVPQNTQQQDQSEDTLQRTESRVPYQLPECLSFIPESSRKEGVWIISLAAPLAASFLAQYACNLITIYYQGSLGHDFLSACANCVFFLNLFVSNIIIGINSGIDALATQAYGAKLYKNVGLVAQRAFVFQLIAFIPMCFMLFFSGSILNGLGFDATVTPKSQAYLRICIWGIFPLMIIDTIRRWLEAQGIVYISTGVAFFGFILCWPLNQLMVRTLGYGAVGSAYTFNIINWLTAAVMVIYVYFSGVWKKTLAAEKFNIKELFDFKQLWNYLKYALPATGTMFSEFFGFEVQAVIAARISKHAVAGQLLIFAINSFLYHIPLSYGVAAATRVGHLLGSKRGQQAKDAFVVLLQLTTLTEIIIAILLILLSNTMPRWFTSDENILEIVTAVIPLLAIFSIFNGNQVSMGGVLRGQGAMRFQFIVNVLCYWALAIPLGYYLALYASEHTYINNDGEKVTGSGIGVMGQWMALGLASFLIQIIYFFYLFYLDWQSLAEKVHKSTHKHANTNLGDHDVIGEGTEGVEMSSNNQQPGQYEQFHDNDNDNNNNNTNNDPFNYPIGSK